MDSVREKKIIVYTYGIYIFAICIYIFAIHIYMPNTEIEQVGLPEIEGQKFEKNRHDVT